MGMFIVTSNKSENGRSCFNQASREILPSRKAHLQEFIKVSNRFYEDLFSYGGIIPWSAQVIRQIRV